MKERNIILLFLIALAAMTSCAEYDQENNLVDSDIKDEYMTFSAFFQNDETKTTLTAIQMTLLEILCGSRMMKCTCVARVVTGKCSEISLKKIPHRLCCRVSPWKSPVIMRFFQPI